MPIWIILILIFILFDIFLFFWVFLKKNTKKLRNKELNYIHSHWIRIIDSANANPSNAVLDADKLLHYILDLHGFQGNTGAKMKRAEKFFTDLNGIWIAHKLRNRIAHEMISINSRQAKMALRSFKLALNDFGARL